MDKESAGGTGCCIALIALIICCIIFKKLGAFLAISYVGIHASIIAITCILSIIDKILKKKHPLTEVSWIELIWCTIYISLLGFGYLGILFLR